MIRPPVTPKCFTSDASFQQWLMLARTSGVLDVYPHAKAYAIELEMERADGDYHEQLKRNLAVAAKRAMHYDRREAPYCMDCTPAYRDKMKAAGRCGFPLTRFRVAVDDDSRAFELVGDRVAA